MEFQGEADGSTKEHRARIENWPKAEICCLCPRVRFLCFVINGQKLSALKERTITQTTAIWVFVAQELRPDAARSPAVIRCERLRSHLIDTWLRGFSFIQKQLSGFRVAQSLF